jgi:hypothetical protein
MSDPLTMISIVYSLNIMLSQHFSNLQKFANPLVVGRKLSPDLDPDVDSVSIVYRFEYEELERLGSMKASRQQREMERIILDMVTEMEERVGSLKGRSFMLGNNWLNEYIKIPRNKDQYQMELWAYI